jgi:hypothetical protein
MCILKGNSHPQTTYLGHLKHSPNSKIKSCTTHTHIIAKLFFKNIMYLEMQKIWSNIRTTNHKVHDHI